MKKLDDFGMWVADWMFREGGFVDKMTRLGIGAVLVYFGWIVLQLIIKS